MMNTSPLKKKLTIMTGFVVQGHNDNVCSVYQNAFPSFTSQNTCSDRRTRFNPPRQSRGVLIMSHCVRRPSANVTSSRASCCPSPRCCRSVSRCVWGCGGYSQPVDSSQSFTPKAFTLFNCFPVSLRSTKIPRTTASAWATSRSFSRAARCFASR